MLLKELLAGILIYKKANHTIFKYKLWPLLILPGVMSLCYILMLVIVGTIYTSGFSGYINENWIPGFVSGDTTYVIVSILLWLFLMVIGFLSYKPIVLILFSPILSYLSETVEKAVYNEDPPRFKFKDLFKDIVRGAVINTRNAGWMLFFTLIAWLLCVIPLVGAVVSPVLLLFIQSYYGGCGLIDYTLERKRFSVSKSVDFAQKNRGRVTGVGMGFILILFIPIIGWFFAPGYGTAAATLATLEKINEDCPE